MHLLRVAFVGLHFITNGDRKVCRSCVLSREVAIFLPSATPTILSLGHLRRTGVNLMLVTAVFAVEI